MTAILRAYDAEGEHEFEKSDFPLGAVASSNGSVVFSSRVESDPLTWFGFDNGHIFVQPLGEHSAIWLNGVALNESAWLSADDEIKIANTSFAVKVDVGVLVISPTTIKNIAPVLVPPEVLPGPVKKAKEVEQSSPEPEPEITTAPSVTPQPGGKYQTRHHYILTGIFVALMLCVIFVLTAAPVRISIEPAPNSMSFRGFPPPVKVFGRYLSLPGSYRVDAKKSGYRKLEESIEVAFGSEPVLDFQLRKLPGSLTILSHPVSNAEVLIDGIVVGKTPLKSYEIEAGKYEVQIAADRFLPVVQSVEIQGMGVGQSIEGTLEPGWGTLSVKSEPEGAEVWMNETVIGQTPLETEPMAGEYQLKLYKEGWKPVSTEVRIEPAETIELPPFRLAKIDGTLDVTTKPSGATVMLNSEFRGRTPITIVLEPDRDYPLALSKSGYLPVSRSVSVDAGKTNKLDIRMKPEYGVVFITSRPAGAKLKVDGKEKGSATQRIKLTTRPHKIEIEKADYETFSTTLTPRTGVSKKLEVRLTSIREAKAKSTPAKLKTSEGQVLSLIRLDEPTRFQMGASRREAGRLSNENQYEVELTRSFYISENEVTNEDFQSFRSNHDSGSENGTDLSEEDQPVVSISWNAAARYLNWLSKKDGLSPAYREEGGKLSPVVQMTTGYRLPTEAEWAFAARYEGGHQAGDKPLKYAWAGNSRTPPNNSGNYADSSATNRIQAVIRGYNDGYSVAAPVGQFPPNKAGLYDVSGNVAEWCHDYYDVNPGRTAKVLYNPMGPVNGKYHVVRGSSWRHGSITELRLSYRDYSEKPRNDLGFRIARYAE